MPPAGEAFERSETESDVSGCIGNGDDTVCGAATANSCDDRSCSVRWCRFERVSNCGDRGNRVRSTIRKRDRCGGIDGGHATSGTRLRIHCDATWNVPWSTSQSLGGVVGSTTWVVGQRLPVSLVQLRCGKRQAGQILDEIFFHSLVEYFIFLVFIDLL